LVEQKLQSHDWLDREAAILALGAISEGCWQRMLFDFIPMCICGKIYISDSVLIKAMKENLHGLVPFLHRLLKDNKFLIRSITCWTISRYAEWIVARASTHLDSIFEPTLYGLLECILDHNKKVQIAACSSFAIFESLAAINIQPYLSLIIETFMKAYSAYQTRALFTLYDAIGHMSKAVGQDLNYPEFVQPLMQPLIQRWNSLSDSDILLLPLLECLTNIAGALAHGFAEFAPPVYDRALKIAQNYLMQYGVRQLT
jgi:transportin-1